MIVLAADSPAAEFPVGHQADKIELEVNRYAASSPMKPVKFDVTQNPIAAAIRARAGELVTVSARGQYSVAGNHEPIDQQGYINGQKRGYNRPQFDKANHAMAIAYVGAPAASHTALAVGSCVAAITPTPGQIYIGVNDNDVSNNQGSLVFEVQLSLPTLDQWRSGGAFACTERAVQPTAEAPQPASTTATPALPDSLDRQMISDSVAKVRPDLFACGSQSTATGIVKVLVKVDASGRVTAISITSAPDAALGECVAAAMRKAIFPPTKNGGSFSQPYTY